MSDKNIEQRLTDILSDQLGVDKTQINRDAQIVQDLGADSLDTVEITMALEEEFDIEIEDEDAEKLTTVGDVLTYLEKAIEEQG
jgi:acyl carrier protein